MHTFASVAKTPDLWFFTRLNMDDFKFSSVYQLMSDKLMSPPLRRKRRYKIEVSCSQVVGIQFYVGV